MQLTSDIHRVLLPFLSSFVGGDAQCGQWSIDISLGRRSNLVVVGQASLKLVLTEHKITPSDTVR
jgi:hypothetical protein